MKATVEFYGVARYWAGAKECQLELDEGAVLHNVLIEVARRFPRLVGERVISHGCELSQSFALCTDDGIVIQNLDAPIADNDRLLLISAIWGG